jgi:ankyrin repeat protein
MHLIEAVIHNDATAVRVALESGADPNACLDHALVTPLHFAAQHNAVDVIPLLITAGAKINARTFPDGQTALDIARLHRHVEMTKLLEEYSVRVQD